MNAPPNRPVSGSAEDRLLMDLVDEVARKVQAGEPIDVGAYLAGHPDQADRLAELLPAVQLLAALGRSAASGETSVLPAADDAGLEPGTLGDFRILREVGRGGMGVVYEAEQISLGRRVALKVLPFAAAVDARQLQRFKQEAQAAAHLLHQNIVAIYGVGCERGVHYYAMQFIDGQPLSAVIRELRRLAGVEPAAAPNGGSALAEELVSGHWAPAKRNGQDPQVTGPFVGQAESSRPTRGAVGPEDPAHPAGPGRGSESTNAVAALSTEHSTRDPAFFRTVAHLGVQAAEALEHAHQQGVVHRDIKPANLLLDAQGRLWVTDFGLARFQGEANLTQTGDLLGTLRYMSPEQAMGRRALIDHRSDLYALGATLYELLALHPACDGAGRAELLRQIEWEEPKALCQHNPAVPAELATIVGKALEKNPADRYATAQELADDLRRFLDDRPIQAKRPTLRQRAAKWARRHRTELRVAVVMLVLALAVSTGLIGWAYQDKKQALERERLQSYLQRIALAEREWSANNLSRMQQFLDECPEELRGWEWHYLKRLRYGTLAPLRHESAVLGVAFSPNGQFLATATQAGVLRIWQARTGQEIRRWPAHNENATGVVFSPDGRFLASGSWDGTVQFWDVEKVLQGEVKAPLFRLTHTGQVGRVAFSPNGQRLASAARTNTDGKGEVKVWDMNTRQEVLTLSSFTPGVGFVQFSPDSRRLATCSAGLVQLWDAQTGQEQLALPRHGRGVQGVAFSPDGRRLASVGGMSSWHPDEEVKVWDTQTGQETLSLRGHVGGLITVAFSPDGRRVASGGLDQTVKLWDAVTGQEALTLRGHLDAVHRVAFSPDGKRLASASWDRTVHIWDATPLGRESSPEYLTLGGHAGAVTDVAFHPTDGRSLASAGTDGTVRVWDTWSGKELYTLPGSPAGLGLRVAYSPDGRRLAALGPGQDQPVRVWDATTATETCSFRGHTAGVFSLAFSPDGRHVASAGFDFTIRVWDAASGKQSQALQGHNWPIHGLAFRPPRRPAPRLGQRGQHGPRLGLGDRPGTARPRAPARRPR